MSGKFPLFSRLQQTDFGGEGVCIQNHAMIIGMNSVGVTFAEIVAENRETVEECMPGSEVCGGPAGTPFGGRVFIRNAQVRYGQDRRFRMRFMQNAAEFRKGLFEILRSDVG